jgi:hypothetical protein
MKDAFTICRIQMGDKEIYDRRNIRGKKPSAILDWLNIVSPAIMCVARRISSAMQTPTRGEITHDM